MEDKIYANIRDALYYNLDERPPYNRISFDRYPPVDMRKQKEPSKEADFCKAYKLAIGRFGFVMGDIPGHGNFGNSIETAVSMILAFDRAVNNNIDRPHANIIMDEVNQIIREYPDHYPHFFYPTLFSVYDISSKKLEIVNAGHIPPIITNAVEARIIREETQNCLLVGEEPYLQQEVKLSVGEKYVVFTDGIVEPSPGEGENQSIERNLESICNEMPSLAHLETSSFNEALFKKVKEIRGIERFQDDATIGTLSVLS